MTTTQAKNWADLADEDEEVLRSHHKEDKITRARTNGSSIIEETVIQKKWVIPVRKQVKERKNWAKFGEVANVPKGEHRPGDYEVSNVVEILTSGEQQGEIGIVAQLSKMTTAGVKEQREKKKLEEIEQQGVEKSAPTEEKKEATSKWTKAFGANVKGPRDDYSVKVSNITSVEKDFREIEKELNDFFSTFFKKLSVDCKRMKYLSSRDSKKFIGKAFFSFNKKEDATKAMDELNGLTYNYSLLEAEPADSNQRPPGTGGSGRRP